MSFSPTMQSVSQSGLAGTTLDYTIQVTNNDSQNCSASAFSLAPVLPGGWGGTVSPSLLTLDPGEMGSTTVSVTSPTDASAGVYNVEVAVTDVPEPLSADYVVEAVSQADTEVPSVPTGLSATKRGKNIKMSFVSS